MRVLVTGDRNWTDQILVWNILTGFYSQESCAWLTASVEPFVVIEGGARGADRCAASWVTSSPLHGPLVDLDSFDPLEYDDTGGGMPVALLRFPADWKQYGRAAGPIRNKEMLVLGKPDLVLAFHDDLLVSKGTADMVRQSRKAGVQVVVIGH